MLRPFAVQFRRFRPVRAHVDVREVFAKQLNGE